MSSSNGSVVNSDRVFIRWDEPPIGGVGANLESETREFPHEHDVIPPPQEELSYMQATLERWGGVLIGMSEQTTLMDVVKAASTEGVGLTERQREVLQLVSEGLTNLEVAERLGIAESTIKFHLSNAYRKLGTSNRTEAVQTVREQPEDGETPEGEEERRIKAPSLTKREVEVLGHASVGLTNSEIAELLDVTIQTIKFHLGNAYRKLGVSNRTMAAGIFTAEHVVESNRRVLKQELNRTEMNERATKLAQAATLMLEAAVIIRGLEESASYESPITHLEGRSYEPSR